MNPQSIIIMTFPRFSQISNATRWYNTVRELLPFVRLSHFAIRSYFTRAITASIISRLFLDLCNAAIANSAWIHARASFADIVKISRSSYAMPFSSRATLYGFAQVPLQQYPRHEYPVCANYFYALFFFPPALKYSRYVCPACARQLLCNILRATRTATNALSRP